MLTTFLLLFTLSAVPNGDGLDSILTIQRERAGIFAEALFQPLENSELTPEETDDYRFLLAYMSLSDLAMVTSEELLENVRLARRAREQFAWGEQLTDELYRHFVLPHRVSQEVFRNGWRQQFMDELTPRLEGLSMTEAALELDHWAHEQVTFKQSDGRDQDPFTTIRSGYGRCEEQMIFVIDALRSVGIPARQCYTPSWPHTDNNHAWVELWADGAWHYAESCNPSPVLDQAWFSRSAGRAMMVISTAYGDYQGDEPILKHYSRSTLVNSTAVYGNTQEREILLLDHKGRPMPDHRVIFSLFNYAFFNPCLGLNTDENGICRITCGAGTWIVSAGERQQIGFITHPISWITGGEGEIYSAIAHSTPADTLTSLELRLTKTENLLDWTELDYAPPSEPPERETVPRDSLFKCRVAWEDSLREADFWIVWATEAGIELGNDDPVRPDSILLQPLADAAEREVSELVELLEKGRGNWGNLYRFLTGSYPTSRARPSDDLNVRLILLETLTDKELRASTVKILEHHFYYTTLDHPLSDSATEAFLMEMDSTDRERYQGYVIAPRIDYEPSWEWRRTLCELFIEHPELRSSKGDKNLLKWLRRNIVVEDEYNRLGALPTPDRTLLLMRAPEQNVARLYVGLCRVRGLPARFNPVSGGLERWDDDHWQEVILFPKKSAKKAQRKGTFVLEADSSDTTTQEAMYLKTWTVSKWETDLADAVDFGYEKPYKDITWPQELPPGLYFLTTGFRREDGSSPVAMTWFEIKSGRETRIALNFRRLDNEEH